MTCPSCQIIGGHVRGCAHGDWDQRDVTVPATFPGSAEERQANRASHWFDPEFERCIDCDCRPWGRVAEWPCGADVPRVTSGG